MKNPKLEGLISKLKNEFLDIFASAVTFGTEEAIIKACSKAFAGIIAYLYNLDSQKRKEIEEKIMKMIEEKIIKEIKEEEKKEGKNDRK